MKNHLTAASAITLMISASLCLALADNDKKQLTQPTKPQAAKPKSAIAEKIIGTWKLVSIDDRRSNPPQREYNPTGYIIYDSMGQNWVRYFELSGNRITLIPVETNDDRSAKSPPVRSLTWERVK